MGKGQFRYPLPQLRALFAAGTATGLTDSELLERYTANRAKSADAATAAEMAFAALVDRHGAMVWGVCLRVLGDVHEAEDAFQATFLVLVRRAGSVRVDGSLGRWLYGVAHRVALRARSEAGRRSLGISRIPPASSDDPVREVELRDLRNVIGEELDRLPAKYRCPVELCHLQGMTYDQAARQLDWPVATVKSRLAKGRQRLRERLVRRGLAPDAFVVARGAALTNEAWAAVPQKLVQSTARAATSCSSGAFSAAVTDLTKGVLKMMMWEKLKLVAVGTVAAVGLGAQALSQQGQNGGIPGARPPQIAVQPAEQTDEKKLGDRRWVRSLPCGAIIEIVGVSSFPSGPDTWWRPDGSPLLRAPCDPNRPGVGGDGVRMLVVARLARIPDGADYFWSIKAGGVADGPAMRDGKSVPGLSEITALFPARPDTCTAVFKVAAGPWKTIQTSGKNASAIGSRIGPSFMFGSALATKEGTALSVTHNVKNKSVRLIAIDVEGGEVTGQVRSGGGVEDFRQLVVEFALPPEQIKEFWFQTRPYEEVEVPRIALKGKLADGG